MGTFTNSPFPAPLPTDSPTDGSPPRAVAFPCSLADLIAETLRLRALCLTIGQTLLVTRGLVDEMERNYLTLLKRCRARRFRVNPVPRRRDRSRTPPPRAAAYRAVSASTREVRRRRRFRPTVPVDDGAIERARLEGAILLARTAAHLINNDLTTTVILNQMIRTKVERGDRIDARMLDDAIVAAKRASRHLIQLQHIGHLDVEPGYGDAPPVLNLR